jgi:hypothetical protein
MWVVSWRRSARSVSSWASARSVRVRFGVGEGALCFDLGVAAVAEGFAFAGGVVPGSLGFCAGVGFGLACAAGLGVGCGVRVAGG